MYRGSLKNLIQATTANEPKPRKKAPPMMIKAIAVIVIPWLASSSNVGAAVVATPNTDPLSTGVASSAA